MGILGSFKDNLSSFSGEQMIKKALQPYGELQSFKINSTSKSMYIKVLLKGEKEPVDVKVNKYELVEERGKTFVRLHDVEASREWITRLAKDYLVTQRFEVPEKYSSMIKNFI
jgi:DNA-binding protein YbaB